MLIYATPEQLRDFMHGPGSPEPVLPNAHKLLRTASELVVDYTSSAVYKTDALGFPIDSGKLAAMRDATCAQAEAWAVAGVEPGTLADLSSRVVASKSLGGRSVTYEANAGAVAERNALASGRELVSHAVGYLERAGLVSTRVTNLRRGSSVG